MLLRLRRYVRLDRKSKNRSDSEERGNGIESTQRTAITEMSLKDKKSSFNVVAESLKCSCIRIQGP